MWDRQSLQCTEILTGHTGPVICLQYDDRVIISGSSDSTVRVCDVETGELLETLRQHSGQVYQVTFKDGMMVTCSEDRTVAVWDMISPAVIRVRRVLLGHK